MSSSGSGSRFDVVVVGSGHNGLIAAAYLAAAGQSVLVLEKNQTPGGATTSQKVFPDYDAWLSRYSYLVSLLPPLIVQELNLQFETRRRTTASFTPWTDSGGHSQGLLISNIDQDRSRQSLLKLTGSSRSWSELQTLMQLQKTIADIAWPSLLQPLQHRTTFLSQLHTAEQREAWEGFVENPLGRILERYADHDLLRGLLMTDAKIGVLTHPHDESLLQNRCFLYHVIGNGNGEWKVPVGGMQSLVNTLVDRCRQHGVVIRTGAEVLRIDPGGHTQSVAFCSDDSEITVDASRVLVNAGPGAFAAVLGEEWKPAETDEGSVIKMNVLLKRLPQLRAADTSPEEAFTGSFHIDEGYQQMLASYQSAISGRIPDPAPAEMYCHSLTDNSILSPELRSQGFHTLTLFGLDMPYRLFRTEHDARRERVKQLYLRGLDRICAEPFLDCVAVDHNGLPCIEIKTPQDLEREISLDLGNIFHNTLSWFFTDDPLQVGKWGVETHHPGIYRAGSSAIRGGAVSGIPGRNCAMCILGELRQ